MHADMSLRFGAGFEYNRRRSQAPITSSASMMNPAVAWLVVNIAVLAAFLVIVLIAVG